MKGNILDQFGYSKDFDDIYKLINSETDYTDIHEITIYMTTAGEK